MDDMCCGDLMSCPLCNKNVYSELGGGCKMCGMVLEDGNNFCSNVCESLFWGSEKRRGGKN